MLGDEKRRAEYDSYGHSFAGGASGFNWSDFTQQNSHGQGFEFDIGDIFENFGDMFGAGFGKKTQTPRGRDISIDIELEFSESIFGVERKILLTKNATCNYCKGSGAKDGTELQNCSTCGGNGRVRENRQSIMGSFTTVRECQQCRGTGKIPKEKCGYCAGGGIVRKEEEIELKIPAGIQDGEVIRMPERGEAVQNGKSGDLYIKLHVKNHKNITRDGFNLYSTLSIKISDALLGSTYKVELIDGTLDIKIPAGIKYGEKLRIKGRGVPYGSKRGDHYVKIIIETPTKLSRTAKKLVEQLRAEGI